MTDTPLVRGFDTRLVNGHSDIVAGAVVGSARLIRQVKHTLDRLGGTLDPHARSCCSEDLMADFDHALACL